MVVRRLDYLSGKSVTGPRDDISASRSVLNSVLSKAQRSMLSRLASRQTLYRSFATIHKHVPSSAYIDAHRSLGPAVTATPPDLKPQERNTLDSALRVDQAGEIAANYIYKGQLAVLGRDPKLAPLIQASCKNVVISSSQPLLLGYVGAREETPGGYGQTANSTQHSPNNTRRCS